MGLRNAIRVRYCNSFHFCIRMSITQFLSYQNSWAFRLCDVKSYDANRGCTQRNHLSFLCLNKTCCVAEFFQLPYWFASLICQILYDCFNGCMFIQNAVLRTDLKIWIHLSQTIYSDDVCWMIRTGEVMSSLQLKRNCFIQKFRLQNSGLRVFTLNYSSVETPKWENKSSFRNCFFWPLRQLYYSGGKNKKRTFGYCRFCREITRYVIVIDYLSWFENSITILAFKTRS